jgi:predicted nucleic acid-binding protein
MRRLFVDTFYLVALAHRRDTWHAAVMAFSRSMGHHRLYTVDEVLVEFLTACSGSGASVRTRAARTVRHALDDNQWTVMSQSRQSLLDALDFYESRRDKAYSLTDCVSMVAMRREGLTEVLTNDHHFTQEGFQILNWLRVLGTTEMPDIDHRVGHQFHRIVPTLDALKPHQ